MEISLSELRPRLKEVMVLVKNGERVTIMERGKPIASITKVSQIPVPDNPETVAQLLAIRVLDSQRDIDKQKDAQKKRDDILRGVNRKS